jgi:VWFA-related protein
MRPLLFFALLAAALSAAAQDDTPVFRSGVSLVRVDVRVTSTDGRPIPHLTANDFVLRDNGRVQPIRNFASEEMPLDVLFLIDVSGSMQSHVERLANASRQALATLVNNDRAGVMVFDRSTRLRQALTANIESVERDLRGILRSEGFNGGTDITRALLDAARYMGANGRKEARRAIIILTDDRTERDRDEFRVEQALRDADTVLSALLAPDAMLSGGPLGGRYPSGRSPSGRYPGGSGGGWGDIIFGRRYPGGGYPAPGGGGGYPRGGGYPMPGGRSRTQSAGTAEIARDSGGDSLPVDQASALQDTLDSLRQRYSLYFSVPAGAQAGEQRRLSVDLASSAARRFPNAQLKFRDDYRAPGGAPPPESPETVTVSQSSPESASSSNPPDSGQSAPRLKRRPMGETYGSHGPNPDVGTGDAAPAQAPAPGAATTPPPANEQTGGWRKATEEDKQQAEAAGKVTPPRKN